MGEAIEEYLADAVRRERMGARTADVTRHFLCGYLREELELPVAALTASDAAAAYERLIATPTKYGRPPSAASHHRALGNASAFARWCIEREIVRDNPFKAIVPQGKPKTGKPQLRPSEAVRFERHCLGQEDYWAATGALLMLYTGLRLCEICRLEPRDIDELDGHWYVFIDGKRAKGGKGEVLLEIPAETARRARRDLPMRGERWLRRKVIELCAAAEVPRVTPHGLRGTNSTLQQIGGQSLSAVAAALGHDPRMTATHYVDTAQVRAVRQRRALTVLRGGKDGRRKD